MFAGNNSLFGGQKAKGQDEDEEEEDGDEGSVKSDGPPAYNPDGTLIPGVTDKPTSLKIESKPIAPSPYQKEFNSMIEKFKILPRPAPKGEEKKDESKKVTMGKGHLSIESALANETRVYLVVFRNLIGKTLYQGTITVQHAKKRRIEEKAMKLQLKLALLVKDSKGFHVEHAVASFSKSDDLKSFEEKFDRAIDTLKNQTTTKSK